MNWIASELTGTGIQATDGSIGSLADFLFDDQTWIVRWVVIDTGTWMSSRKVLLPPSCLRRQDNLTRDIHVELTQSQVKESPELDTDAPVSRQMEAEIYAYYAWPPYWIGGFGDAGAGIAGGAVYRPIVPPRYEPGASTQARAPSVEREVRARQMNQKEHGDPHLRSTEHVTGLSIHASDGSIGHVEDFIIDADNWMIRYIAVDTVNWWPGKRVLIAPEWILDISWPERSVTVDLSRDHIKQSPEYKPGELVDRPYEERLYAHYRLPPYWL